MTQQQNNTSANNKRIAKNTIALYIRMLVSLIINLYTSRVILEVLGVSDFGIYNLIGGIVVLMAVLNTSMSGATSRFLTFDIGRGDIQHLKYTFCSALQLHFIIAIIVLIVGETIGLWFVNTQIVIPIERMYAANWVYQMSLLVMLVGIMQVTFSANVIAREHMDGYAAIEIVNVIMKLCIVLSLSLVKSDRLIAYSTLLAALSILIFSIYVIYCKRKFTECNFSTTLHKNILKPILKFCLLDLYGNVCVSICYQGRNILINQFFGVVYNAAAGVATQASAAVEVFTRNIIQAFRPQIIKEYSVNNIMRMQRLITLASIICALLMGCIITPLYLNMDYIMQLWLKTVPPEAVRFCQIMLIIQFIGLLNQIIVIGVHATGEIKVLSYFGGTVFLFVMPTIWICFRLGLPVYAAYLISIPQLLLTYFVDLWLLKKQINQIKALRILIDVIKAVAICLASLLLTDYLSIFINSNFLQLFFSLLFNAIFIIILSMVFIKDLNIKQVKRLFNR